MLLKDYLKKVKLEIKYFICFKMLNLYNYGVLKIVMFYFFFSYCDLVEVVVFLGINGIGVVIFIDCFRGYYCFVSIFSSIIYFCLVGIFNNDIKF